MKAKLGIAPIAWRNDDLADRGDGVSPEECLAQARGAEGVLDANVIARAVALPSSDGSGLMKGRTIRCDALIWSAHHSAPSPAVAP